MANQNGTTSLNGIVSRLAFAIERIVFIGSVYCSIRRRRLRVWQIFGRHFRANHCSLSGMRTSWCPAGVNARVTVTTQRAWPVSFQKRIAGSHISCS